MTNKFRLQLPLLVLSAFLGGCATQMPVNSDSASCGAPDGDSPLWQTSPELSLTMEYTDACGWTHTRPMNAREVAAAPEMLQARAQGQTARMMELAEAGLLSPQQKRSLRIELERLVAAGDNVEVHRSRLALLEQYGKRRLIRPAIPRVKTRTRIVTKHVEVPQACPSAEESAEQMCGNLMKINPF